MALADANIWGNPSTGH